MIIQILIGSYTLVLLFGIILVIAIAIHDFGLKALFKFFMKVSLVLVVFIPLTYYLGGFVMSILK